MFDGKGVAFKDLCLPIESSKNLDAKLDIHVLMKYRL